MSCPAGKAPPEGIPDGGLVQAARTDRAPGGTGQRGPQSKGSRRLPVLTAATGANFSRAKNNCIG
ncbi:hypothetical protein PUN4_80050 [Paraburkholderia unamae]|nr:hypothetical protein PUN4_80050 [Paraburkholderia unamae]